MPGIVGFVSKKWSSSGLLKAMVTPMLHRPTYCVSTHVQEKFACATIDLAAGRQNALATSNDGQCALIFYGAIYEEWINHEKNLAAQLLERWNQGGWKALADLNGEYLVVIWDRTEERLTIINDRLGLKRLNYWCSDTAFAFASEVKSLAVLPEVDRTID